MRFRRAGIGRLRDHMAELTGAGNQEIAYSLGQSTIIFAASEALKVAALAMARLARETRRSAMKLRVLAEVEPPLDAQGYRNLAGWVGRYTPEWHAAFAHSSQDPRAPWFCTMEPLAQSIALLFVAEYLEDISDFPLT